MGLDVRSGLMFGTKFYDFIGKVEYKTVEVTRYNPNDGTPYQGTFRREVVNVQTSILDFITGDVIPAVDFEKAFHEVFDELVDEVKLVLPEGMPYFGFQIISHYVDNNWATVFEPIELAKCIERAEEMWKKYFPNIPGKIMLYTEFSY